MTGPGDPRVESAGERSYVRFQAARPHRHGRQPGVFGLVDGLWAAGHLSAREVRFRRVGNDWFSENLTNPSDVDPRVYDRDLHPGAASWFKAEAVSMIERVEGYLAILDTHGVAWERLDSTDPGDIVYDDAEQVVVVPFGHNHLLREPVSGYSAGRLCRGMNTATTAAQATSAAPTHTAGTSPST
ncbi:hypothetical protein [Nocardia sp. NPDC058633]|uniref:hypothetical protein n=1 Tax=Nocardia sp. NPDC058633 TaxID=3346568 RepID=UPI00364641DF